MLFVHIGKSSSENLRSSRSQMFFKIGVLKISQCSQKTPVFESLFNKVGALKACIFIKKEIPTQVSSSKYCEIFKNSFFVQHFLFIILLRDDRILWRSLGTKLTCFIFLVLLLCFPSYRKSIVVSYLFYTKISSKRNFRTHFNVDSSSILTESLKTRNICRTLALLLVIYCEKCEFFEYYALFLSFFRSCLAVMARNNPTEKQIDVETQAALQHRSA